METIYNIFNEPFMPQGSCYLWNPELMLLQACSDLVIGFAYYSIPFLLIYFVRQRKDLVHNWIFLCFAVFIIACGTTHFIEVISVWHPLYWLEGFCKAVTALVSIATALALIRLLPKALSIPSPQILKDANLALQKEINQHRITLKKLEEINFELQLKAAQVESANKELETFSYSVSHDLRSPLRHIDGFMSLLADDPETRTGETGKNYIQIISQSVVKMNKLIDDLLYFSQMNRAELKRQVVNTRTIIEEVLLEISLDCEGRTINWSIGELPAVEADPSLLKQIWFNLISNAVKYSQKKDIANIEIKSHELDHEIEFQIRDNGAGFDMHYVDKLFGIFQRLHLSEEFEGTGIGLALVKRIINRHGGRIWAQARVGEGATFFFTLPKYNRQIR